MIKTDFQCLKYKCSLSYFQVPKRNFTWHVDVGSFAKSLSVVLFLSPRSDFIFSLKYKNISDFQRKINAYRPSIGCRALIKTYSPGRALDTATWRPPLSRNSTQHDPASSKYDFKTFDFFFLYVSEH